MAETGSREAPLPGFEGLVGQSPAMQALFRRLARLAVVDVSVLILGETGTGKELVAAALHRLSPRRGARFEPVNCGGLSRELLRSELFGHERGAFTGAVERQAGLLREADGGTVFLDEVGELRSTPRPCSCGSSATARSVPSASRGPSTSTSGSSRRPTGICRGGDPARHLPGGPLLPAPRGRPPGPAAARAAGGSPAPGGALPPAVQRALRARHRRGDTRRAAGAGGARLAGQRAGARGRGPRGHGPQGAGGARGRGSRARPGASGAKRIAGLRVRSASTLRPATQCLRTAIEIAESAGERVERRARSRVRALARARAPGAGRSRPVRASAADRAGAGNAVRGRVRHAVSTLLPSRGANAAARWRETS